MTMFCVIMLVVPLLACGVAHALRNSMSLGRLLAVVAASAAVTAASASIVSCSNVSDVETWNGRVAHKDRERVDCTHSYQCNCRQECTTTANKGQSCTQVCDTCYEHDYDVDWNVTTTNHELVTIDRVDRQGIHEPSRWASVRIGDPTSMPHRYDNYVKGAPGTLFRHQGLAQRYLPVLPPHPEHYDYYRSDHLVTAGELAMSPEERAAWNSDLAELNSDLGSAKQANVIVVLVADMPDDFYYALEEAWVGGKKNDVILVASVSASGDLRWASVMCWTSNELFRVALRDHVMFDERLDRRAVVKHLHEDVGGLFVRKPMKDFEYLQASIVPTADEWALCLIINLLVAGAVLIALHVDDPDGGRGPGWARAGVRRRRYSYEL